MHGRLRDQCFTPRLMGEIKRWFKKRHTFCREKPIGPICSLDQCDYVSAVEFLLIKHSEVCASEWNHELELYILYNPARTNHGVSIDLRLNLIYDSGSDFKKPYKFGVEVLELLGFERNNKSN